MRVAIFSILLLFGIEALSQGQIESVAYTPPTHPQVIQETSRHLDIPFTKGDFGNPYKSCEGWGTELVTIDGISFSMPIECISYRVCKELPIPNEPVLVSCPCYEDITNHHLTSWDPKQAYFVNTVLGSGETIEQAKQSARSKCHDFRGILEQDNPDHHAFNIPDCRQVGKESCSDIVFYK